MPGLARGFRLCHVSSEAATTAVEGKGRFGNESIAKHIQSSHFRASNNYPPAVASRSLGAQKNTPPRTRLEQSLSKRPVPNAPETTAAGSRKPLKRTSAIIAQACPVATNPALTVITNTFMPAAARRPRLEPTAT